MNKSLRNDKDHPRLLVFFRSGMLCPVPRMATDETKPAVVPLSAASPRWTAAQPIPIPSATATARGFTSRKASRAAANHFLLRRHGVSGAPPQLLRRPPFCRTSGPSSAYFLTSFPLNSLEKSTCHTQFLSCTREARAGPNGSISMAYSLRPNAEPPLTGRLPERCFSGTVPPFP